MRLIFTCVKSGSSGLKSNEGPEGRRKVSVNWTGGPTEDNGGGDLVRTWCRDRKSVV